MRKPIVAGNWKMHKTTAEARQLVYESKTDLDAIVGVDVVFCPPFTALAEVAGLNFSRIQFTPDLMPADIIGTHVVHETEAGEKVFRFQRGPVFANIVLADEINRPGTHKTSSLPLSLATREATKNQSDNRFR